MAFTSGIFLIFLAFGLLVFYLIPKRFQWIWLLICSYFFYAMTSVKAMAFIMFTTITTFLAGRILGQLSAASAKKIKEGKGVLSRDEKKAIKNETKKKMRRVLLATLVANFGILAFIKYANFTIDNINTLFQWTGSNGEGLAHLNLILPLGISFYTFQSMGYIIDVYQGKYEPDRNIFKFALFVSFFPQILQGPIGRYNDLAHQLYEKHSFKLERVQYGLQLMLWGYFKKIVIADRIGILVNKVFDHYTDYGGVAVIAAVLGYSLWLYGDFSGGMDVVGGVAEMFDIDLAANFKRPYFAKNIGDFWRRWHITLGAWMKDYIFYPMTLSKGMLNFGKKAKKVFGDQIGRVLPIAFANIVIFLVVGIWHGAAWKYIAYGLYNGLIIAISSLLTPVYKKGLETFKINADGRLWHLWQIIRTFILVNISWYFDNAQSFSAAIYMMKSTVTHFCISNLWDGTLMQLGIGRMDYMILAVCTGVWFIISVLQEKGIKIRESIAGLPLVVRWALYAALIFVIPILGNNELWGGGFIYAQF